MDKKKIKLVIGSDIFFCHSGVGLQMKYVVDGLVESGNYQIIALGGAIKHKSYQPIKVEEWGDDVVVIPVDGYGSPDLFRQLIDIEKPDAILIITDPRYWTFLFQMADEIHQQCPIIYWNLWDNADRETWPRYNASYYDACDALPCINKLTHKFLEENGWKDKASYLPHAVPESDFTILDSEKTKTSKNAHLGEKNLHRFVGFYNSRNAMRKRTGTVIMAWREFLIGLPEEERDDCVLCMKTPPKDPEGQDLFAIIRDVPDLKGRVAIVDGNFNNDVMNEFYNMADFTISMSSEEGFGLSILESLMTGTPLIAGRTGGIQDQIIDEETGDTFGIVLEPDCYSLIGSQTTPYIKSHHFGVDQTAKAIRTMYDRWKEHGDNKEYWAGQKARDSALRRFGMEQMQSGMDKVLIDTIDKFKSEKENKEIRVLEF